MHLCVGGTYESMREEVREQLSGVSFLIPLWDPEMKTKSSGL